jgi:integrase
MRRDSVKGVKKYESKGKVFCYHRKTGIRIVAPFRSAAFFVEVAALDTAVAKPGSPAIGTLGALIESYRKSMRFTDLAKCTRSSYQHKLDLMKAAHGMPLVKFTPAFVAEVRDDIAGTHGRRTANYVLSVLSIAAKHGIERDMMKINPCTSVDRVRADRNKPKANRPWTAKERQAAMMGLPPHVALVVGLAMFTGLRKGDILTLSRTAVVGTRLSRKTNKTGQNVTLPLHPDIVRLIEARPPSDHDRLCLNSYGRPWTVGGFNAALANSMTVLKKKGVVGNDLTFHGLRHTVGTLLRGLTDDLDLIRRWLGHKNLHMTVHYSEDADMSASMDAVMTRFDPLGSSTNCLTAPEKMSNSSNRGSRNFH